MYFIFKLFLFSEMSLSFISWLSHYCCNLKAFYESICFCFFSSPVNLTYDVFDGKGESTPLVFLHGLFGSKSNFHSIAKSLVQRTGRKVKQR